jgi:hypothetical protein
MEMILTWGKPKLGYCSVAGLGERVLNAGDPQPGNPNGRRLRDRLRLRNEPRHTLERPKPECAMPVAESGDHVTIDPFRSAKVSYRVGVGIEAVYALARSQVDSTEAVFREATHAVAGEPAGRCVVDEAGVLGRRVVNPGGALLVRSDPEPSESINIEAENLPPRRTLSRTQPTESAGSKS